MIILRGKETADAMTRRLKERIAALDHVPVLATVRIGDKPDSVAYERSSARRMDSFGMRTVHYVFPGDIREEDFIGAFGKINQDPAVDGILLMRPFPEQISGDLVERVLHPDKDLDGISPINKARVFCGDPRGFAPAVAEACIRVLEHNQIGIAGKRVTIVGRSAVVGRPLAMLLLMENATLQICHTKTVDLWDRCHEADILVTCAGIKNLITRRFVKPGAVVIDVGFNVDDGGKLCGDLDFDNVRDVAAAATPVPGGVGAVTTAVLADHLVRAAELQAAERSGAQR